MTEYKEFEWPEQIGITEAAVILQVTEGTIKNLVRADPPLLHPDDPDNKPRLWLFQTAEVMELATTRARNRPGDQGPKRIRISDSAAMRRGLSALDPGSLAELRELLDQVHEEQT